jgi:hypothetical protein
MKRSRLGLRAEILILTALAALGAGLAVGAFAGGPALAPVDASTLGTCSAAVHDRFVVSGPDGNPYRTWHPQEVPVVASAPQGAKCRFAHEHGDDPKKSRADRSLPAFGYINAVAGAPHDEPHEGFKVFVVNKGFVNDEGRRAKAHSRIVAHMGTGGVGRYTRPHHSLELDLKAGKYRVHAQGMADTALAGSICDRDAGLGIGRTVVVAPGTGCDVGSLYEIWQFVLSIRHPNGTEVARIHASTAAFDPISVMNPADRSQLILTRDAYPQWGSQFGCNREAYHGPVYWYNRLGTPTYRTDAFGVIVASGGLEQEISRHDAIGIPMSPDQSQFKWHLPTCAPGLGLKN